jgi:DNA (cytosine-5)-methyltransferase 1
MTHSLNQNETSQQLITTHSIKVFDFFSGCGGSSKGFEQAGMEIVFALDQNPDAIETFQTNFSKAKVLLSDIRDVSVDDLKQIIAPYDDHPTLFCGCAPCQPFSKQNKRLRTNDERRTLLDEFLRFVRHYRPTYVFIENVPGLQKVKDKNNIFYRFLNTLKELNYNCKFNIVCAQDYGVPQKRKRLILIASRLGRIDFPAKTHGPQTNQEYSTVRESIGHFPPLSAGENDPTVPNHQAAGLSALNLERLRALLEGEGREKWPEKLRLACHSGGYNGHSDVYGRMRWDGLANCLTTRCTSLSNGRFGHPDQDRAISAREAASLQTFPDHFIFQQGITSVAKQIGNAVPVLLAKQFGLNFVHHLANHSRRTT